MHKIAARAGCVKGGGAGEALPREPLDTPEHAAKLALEWITIPPPGWITSRPPLKARARVFVRRDDAEVAWSLLSPVLQVWADPQNPKGGPLHPYEAGSWGPAAGDFLIEQDGRSWRKP